MIVDRGLQGASLRETTHGGWGALCLLGQAAGAAQGGQEGHAPGSAALRFLRPV